MDSSKINRVINIVVEEPDYNYIEVTANEISKNINESIYFKSQNIVKAISFAYIDYINNNNGDEIDFHGFRDFYYFIKYIFYNFNEISKKSVTEFYQENHLGYVIKGIQKNFGGLPKSIDLMENKFITKYSGNNFNDNFKVKYNIVDFIKDNIESLLDNRYLLLITKNEEMCGDLIKYLFKNKQYMFFNEEDVKKDDINDENEFLNLLIKIQLQMEKDARVILNNLEEIYPSFYELLNKNMSEIDGREYAKIYYGNINSFKYVNDKFRIIVIVNKVKLQMEDKPFLNRFEKHELSFENILNENLISVAKDIFDFISKNIFYINDINSNEQIFLEKFKRHLINGKLEDIQGLIFKISNESLESDNVHAIIDKAIEIIVPIFSEEIMYLSSIHTFNFLGLVKNGLIEKDYKRKLFEKS